MIHDALKSPSKVYLYHSPCPSVLSDYSVGHFAQSGVTLLRTETRTFAISFSLIPVLIPTRDFIPRHSLLYPRQTYRCHRKNVMFAVIKLSQGE